MPNRSGQYKPGNGIAAEEHSLIIESWYDAQDVWTKDRIDHIGDRFEAGIKKRRPGHKAMFGPKSKRELCYALAHFIDRNRSY